MFRYPHSKLEAKLTIVDELTVSTWMKLVKSYRLMYSLLLRWCRILVSFWQYGGYQFYQFLYCPQALVFIDALLSYRDGIVRD